MAHECYLASLQLQQYHFGSTLPVIEHLLRLTVKPINHYLTFIGQYRMHY